MTSEELFHHVKTSPWLFLGWFLLCISACCVEDLNNQSDWTELAVAWLITAVGFLFALIGTWTIAKKCPPSKGWKRLCNHFDLFSIGLIIALPYAMPILALPPWRDLYIADSTESFSGIITATFMLITFGVLALWVPSIVETTPFLKSSKDCDEHEKLSTVNSE